MSMRHTLQNYRVGLLPLFLALGSVLAVGPAALGQTVDLYQNDTQLISPPDYPPSVDATNFVNNGVFSITLPYGYSGPQPYITANTLNFTNTGTMFCNSGFDLETFRDNSADGQPASNYCNTGIINCGVNSSSSNNFFFSGSTVRMIVAASNIVNPGNINMAKDSLLKLTGQNVNLSRAQFTMASSSGGFGFGYNSANVTSTGNGIGISPPTNTYSWDPSQNLGQNYADSPVFKTAGGFFQYLFLNSTPYVTSNTVGTNVIIQAVFVQKPAGNLSTRVFMNPGFSGGGSAQVEWAGTYVDPRSGSVSTNYFYLFNDFTQTTNSTVYNGIPSGFSFSTSLGTPQFNGTPVAPGLTNGVFFSGKVTNLYSYVATRVTATSVDTNTIAGGSISNLPGRLEINANRSLDMSLLRVSGPNFVSLQCPNQFDGNGGGLLSAPFAIINLGVTNGNLTISNLMASTLPLWSGTVEALNIEWFTTATNGTTYDFRVLFVDGELISTASAVVEKLTLHATNNVVISDVYNISRTLAIDAQRLTLSTNGFGNGAASPDGELNLAATSFSWASSLPNLRWLTNDGAINIPNSSQLQTFGSAAPGGAYHEFISRGLINVAAASIWAEDFQSTGAFANTGASFTLQAGTATINNGPLSAFGDINITAASLSTSNLLLQAGRSLTLIVTNRLTDNGVTSGSVWTVGDPNGAGSKGFVLAIKPATGDLLGTTISNVVPASVKQVFNTWAGQDRGASISGYADNVAVGRLLLDSLGTDSQFVFSGIGPGATNALYVDYLELRDWATNRDVNGNFPQLSLNSNLVIYYAQAVIDGVSIAEKMNHKNGDRLRWVPSYAGYFSSTNLVFGGITNTVNAAAAQSTHLDSDGDGIANAFDPTPFFLSSQVNFTVTLTNQPARAAVLTWNTIPYATNYVFYRTNLTLPNWQLLTNFVSPVAYPSPPVPVTVTDPVGLTSRRYYQVRVDSQLP